MLKPRLAALLPATLDLEGAKGPGTGGRAPYARAALRGLPRSSVEGRAVMRRRWLMVGSARGLSRHASQDANADVPEAR